MTSMQEYIAMRGMNWSSIKHAATSLKLYKHRVDHPEEPKAHFALGSAAHCCVLEPDLFAERYAECDMTRNARHAAYQEWMERNPGREALKPSEIRTARTIAEAVHSHPVAGPLLQGGRFEVPMQWRCPHTGVLLKGRPDYLRERVNDLKTARAIDSHSTGRAMAEYLYHGQLAMYHDGAVALGLIPRTAPPPTITWVEKSPPYDVAVDEFDEFALEAGRRLYVGLIEQILTAAETDMWPGQAPSIRTVNIPGYAPGTYEESAVL